MDSFGIVRASVISHEPQNVADLLVEVFADAGVGKTYGVSGDSLNGITYSIRSRGDVQWVGVRHEETAAFAAGAEAHLTGGAV